MKNLLIKKIEKTLQIFFKNKKLNIKDNTRIKDIKKWDSLNHIKIIVLLEKQFKIKFSGDQIYKIKNINDIVKKITKK
tara:strand:+ start:703 stop:936 length:234 start_codon:yes stop_codon:yes gene_type:complete